MAKRIVSAVVGIALFAGVVAASLYFRYAFSVFVALLDCIAVWEVFSAVKMTKRRPMLFAAMLVGAAMPFLSAFQSYIFVVCFAYIVFNFAYMIFHHETVKMEQIMLAGGLSIILSASFSSLCRLFDMGLDGRYGMNEADGIFLLVLSCAVAWLADTGAYFTGVFFGKHKLCPKISPKKTVEGAIGGVLGTMVFGVLVTVIYSIAADRMEEFTRSNIGVSMYVIIALLACVAAVLGIYGDLFASVVKRQCGIKDYGTIFPGHGGILDRFDSVMFIAPFVTMVVIAVFYH